jgi:hypothetical protein
VFSARKKQTEVLAKNNKTVFGTEQPVFSARKKQTKGLNRNALKTEARFGLEANA